MTSDLSAKNQHIIIVISEFIPQITERLLKGAVDSFLYYNGLKSHLKIFRIPGAFEIPGTIQQVIHHQKPHAVVALGAVIRGETPHFNFVAGESARGIAELSRNADIPIINGIITTETKNQAMMRSVPGGRNKGWDAMEAALKTVSIYREIQATL